ncbi:general substrate transporter [Annulohypoxylon maeteangense]|uniref:general substrate transporter n=1 Tax=Annulohypoxylon maeteangense TaxID=1927788 RepID=UPI0020074DD2|nr:general substrate transporter [Annulohypoxylon maeteangense]KAI0880315.1 general substrate transporter [Annulohypoxylon maeteangense]
MEAATKIPETSLWANRKCLLICAIVAIANMQYGLDSAAIGSLQAMPGFLEVFGYKDPSQPSGYAIEGTFQRLIGSLLTLGAFLSSLIAGAFAHFFGRKDALWLACVLNAVACIIQISTTDKAAVYVGRLILGLANGFLVTFSNIYTAEAAPAHLRAVMVALFSEWVNIGSIIGAAVTNATKNRLDKASYQIPLGTLFIVPTFLAVGLFFVPESPRYLLYKGQSEAARRSLKSLRGGSLSPEGFEIEWIEMVKGIEEEKHTANTIGPLDMFKGTELRRTLLCYGVIATQTGAGSWFIISYSTYFMIVAGLSVDDAFKFSVMNTCLGFIGVNCGMYLMRHVMGRRTVLMTGAVTQGFAMLGMAVSATVASGTVSARNCVIAFTALYQFSYNAFVGDATYPTATELVSTRLRSWSVGSAISLGYFLAWLTGFCSPYFINPGDLNWGAKYAYIWAGSNLCCLVFFFLCVPETKGRTLEEIDELFANRVSVNNFKTFKTTIVEEALKDIEMRVPGKGKLTSVEHVDKI